MVFIRVNPDQPIHKELRRFKKKVHAENILGEVGRRRYYLSPSAKRREKRRRAKRMRRRRQ